MKRTVDTDQPLDEDAGTGDSICEWTLVKRAGKYHDQDRSREIADEWVLFRQHIS